MSHLEHLLVRARAVVGVAKRLPPDLAEVPELLCDAIGALDVMESNHRAELTQRRPPEGDVVVKRGVVTLTVDTLLTLLESKVPFDGQGSGEVPGCQSESIPEEVEC